LRYSDLPPEVHLVVPTPAAFAAMKLVAWSDRQAPRDLFDLHQLAVRGYFTPEVLELTRHLTGYPSSPATLGTWIPPATLESWNAELGQQAGDLPAPSACLQIVLKALDRLAPARE